MNSGDYQAFQRQKLTAAQLDEIKRRYDAGETAISLAIEYGVRTKLIYSYCGKRSS